MVNEEWIVTQSLTWLTVNSTTGKAWSTSLVIIQDCAAYAWKTQVKPVTEDIHNMLNKLPYVNLSLTQSLEKGKKSVREHRQNKRCVLLLRHSLPLDGSLLTVQSWQLKVCITDSGKKNLWQVMQKQQLNDVNSWLYIKVCHLLPYPVP